MLPPLPWCSRWASNVAQTHPSISAFPVRVDGSACTSTFSRLARRSLALRPAHSRGHQFRDPLIEGFRHVVSFMHAPIASGWSGCRVGLAPTGKRRLGTAHTQRCHSPIKPAISGADPTAAADRYSRRRDNVAAAEAADDRSPPINTHQYTRWSRSSQFSLDAVGRTT